MPMFINCFHCGGDGREPVEYAIQRGGSGYIKDYHEYPCSVCEGRKQLYVTQK